jgi:hypothetical protein
LANALAGVSLENAQGNMHGVAISAVGASSRTEIAYQPAGIFGHKYGVIGARQETRSLLALFYHREGSLPWLKQHE